jgi:hypothetical protein
MLKWDLLLWPLDRTAGVEQWTARLLLLPQILHKAKKELDRIELYDGKRNDQASNQPSNEILSSLFLSMFLNILSVRFSGVASSSAILITLPTIL